MKTTPTSECRALADLLPLLDKPESDAALVTAAHAHLATCPACQEEHAAYLRLESAARRLLGPAAIPAHQTEDILRDLLREDPTEKQRPSAPGPITLRRAVQPRRTRRVLSGLASLAAVLVVALLVGALLRNHARPVTPGTPTQPGASATSAPPAPAGPGELLDIAMISPTEGWAVGETSPACTASGGCNTTALLLHYLNGQWSPVILPFSQPLSSLSMLSASDGWASGPSLLLHYDGHSWKQQPNPDHLGFVRLQMFSDTSGWAVAVDPNTNKSGMYLYDGHTWTLQPLPESLLAAPYSSENWNTFWWGAFSMRSATEGWASIILQQSGTSDFRVGAAILHYSSGQWTLQAIIPNAQINSLSMLSATDGWAVGNTVLQKQPNGTVTTEKALLLHYTQGQWLNVELVAGAACCPGQVVMYSASDGWIITSGYSLLHYTGSQWSAVGLPALQGGASLSSLAIVSDTEAWAVGSEKNLRASTAQDFPVLWVILHYHNGAWSVVAG